MIKTYERRELRVLAHFLRIIVGILSGPVDFLFLPEKIMDSIDSWKRVAIGAQK